MTRAQIGTALAQTGCVVTQQGEETLDNLELFGEQPGLILDDTRFAIDNGAAEQAIPDHASRRPVAVLRRHQVRGRHKDTEQPLPQQFPSRLDPICQRLRSLVLGWFG